MLRRTRTSIKKRAAIGCERLAHQASDSGAIASKVRIEDPLFSSVLFGVYFGLLVWGGLYLRDERLRSLLPLRRDD